MEVFSFSLQDFLKWIVGGAFCCLAEGEDRMENIDWTLRSSSRTSWM